MKRLLKIYVKNDVFGGENMPLPTNRRFFPQDNIIRARMVSEKRKLRYSMIDQECLSHKIQTWKTEDPEVKIFFRPKSKNVDEKLEKQAGNGQDLDDDVMVDVDNGFLFVYQASWQRELLERYGKELILLDATYKTTRYTLPLFFLTVKTNVDYQIVATFVTESETKNAITEAVQIISDWNPNFQPLYGMTDYCNEEIDALESVFPGKLT